MNNIHYWQHENRMPSRDCIYVQYNSDKRNSLMRELGGSLELPEIIDTVRNLNVMNASNLIGN